MEEFDLFTFIATIVNFLVLLFLLRTFLYKRVLKAMDERQKHVEKTWDEAADAREKAEGEKEKHRREREELKQDRQRLDREARQKAEEIRTDLVEKAKRELSDRKKEWFQTFESEKERAAAEFEENAARELSDAVRSVMKDLADTRLEESMVRKFLRKCGESGIGDELAHAEEAVLRSGFSLDDEMRKDILAVLSREAGDGLGKDNIRFVREDEIICGIELEVGNIRVAWNVDRYIRDAVADLKSTE
jgi:F-type H+-transporting ATPase subunit b